MLVTAIIANGNSRIHFRPARAGYRLLLSLLGLTALLQAQDPAHSWPQWRGPHLDGSSQTARNLPVEWSETKNVVWRAKLPSWAAATPIVWGDTVFVTSAGEGFGAKGGSGIIDRALDRIRSAFSLDDDLLLLALDRKTGKERWRAVIGAGNRVESKQNMATPSPVTDGKHVWVMTGTGTLSCFDFQGKLIWQRDIVKDYGAFGLLFGYASSPLLHQGRVYLQVLHGMNTDDPSYVLAFDALSGKTLWKVERPTDAISESPDAYSTPLLSAANGRTELIVSGGDYVTGHNLASGKEQWRAAGLNPDKAGNYRIIASPLVAGDVLLVPTRRRPLTAFRLAGAAGAAPRRLWSTDNGPDIPTPTTDGERLYIIDDRGIVSCLRVEDGTVIWDRQRLEPGTYSASPVLADGKIYATSEEGTTTVLKAGGDFEILSVNKLNDYTLASPAVAGSQIFLRTSNYLYCLENRATARN
jgi:outer membrane protein assembly factor BamB